MKKAFVFPGQGAQFVGMGKDLYENSPEAKELFEKANEILGFRITDLMFNGTDEDLKQTKVTQPAIFLHSVILANSLTETPDMVAGHSWENSQPWSLPKLYLSKTDYAWYTPERWRCKKPAKPILLPWPQ